MPTKLTIDSLSPHLFWDVDRSKLDTEKNKRLIIHRALEYGLMNDWNWIKEVYGLETIKEVVVQLRNLDDVTLAFLCNILKLKKEDFRCYTHRQSMPHYWNY